MHQHFNYMRAFLKIAVSSISQSKEAVFIVRTQQMVIG